MTDSFFDRLEHELVAAGRRRRAMGRARFLRNGSLGRRPLLVAVVALTLAAVPAVAAITGVWDESPPEPGGDGAGGAVIPDIGERPCTIPTPERPPTSDDPAPAELLELLGVLRRPRTAEDALPGGRGPGLAGGVNPDAIRLARTDADGRRWFVVPAENIHYEPRVPDTPECQRVGRRRIEPEVGVCLVEVASHREGGAGCGPARGIREGFAQLSTGAGPGERRGTAHVAGIVPDGVTRVVLEFSRGPQRRVVADVRENVYSATYNGSPVSAPRTFWHTADGVREVAKPRRPTAHGRRARKRRRALDRAAGPRPSIYPERGGRRTIFTVRLRWPTRRAAFLVTLRGPGGRDCSPTTERTGALPGRGGLLHVLYSPYTLNREKWCPGVYRGAVERDPRGADGLSRPGRRRQVGSFSFRVR